MSNYKVTFLDTETNCLDLDKREIIQLAMMSYDDYPRCSMGVMYNKMYDCQNRIDIPAMAIHHITPEMLDGKSLFNHSGAKEEIEKLSNDGYIFVMHNAQFDLEALNKYDIQIEDSHVIDTLKVARSILDDGAGNDLESYSEQYLRYYLGTYKKEPENLKPHDALSDVIILKHIFDVLATKMNVEAMAKLDFVPFRNMPFGKHKGDKIEELADRAMSGDRGVQGYIKWLMDNTDGDDVKRSIKLEINKLK